MEKNMTAKLFENATGIIDFETTIYLNRRSHTLQKDFIFFPRSFIEGSKKVYDHFLLFHDLLSKRYDNLNHQQLGTSNSSEPLEKYSGDFISCEMHITEGADLDSVINPLERKLNENNVLFVKKHIPILCGLEYNIIFRDASSYISNYLNSNPSAKSTFLKDKSSNKNAILFKSAINYLFENS